MQICVLFHIQKERESKQLAVVATTAAFHANFFLFFLKIILIIKLSSAMSCFHKQLCACASLAN